MSLPSHSQKMESCSSEHSEAEQAGCQHYFKLDWSDDNPFGWLECTYCGEQQSIPSNTTKEEYQWMRRSQLLSSMYRR